MDDDANPHSDAHLPSGRVAPLHRPSDGTALPAGFRLSEFALQRVLGEGGFGIVYLAWDHSLERQVALKEYLPSALAGRVGACDVVPHSERHRETFELGLRSFINEAKALARFDHPSLVKVYRFWEAHGTAYMVMPFYEGRTVKDTVRSMAGRPAETWLLALLLPLTDALAVVHADQWFHRDIAPDNILLLADGGRPLLIDFGAARRVIGDRTQNLTVILKSGYAPVEQYAEVPGMRQGPWTDVYALGAVAYWVITGDAPPPSIGRIVSDTLLPVSQVAAGRYSPQLLSAIDQALALRPDARLQSMQAFRAALVGTAAAPVAAPLPPPAADDEATVIRPARTGTSTQAPSMATPTSAPASASASAFATTTTTTTTAAADAPGRATAPATDTPHRRPWPMLAAAGLAAALVVAALLWWRSPVTPAVLPGAEVAATPASSAASARAAERPTTPAPPATPASSAAVVPVPAPPFVPAPAPSPTPVPAPAAAPAAATPTSASPNKPPGPNRAASGTRPARPGQTPAPAAAQASPKGGGDQAECARVLQQLSLGESSPELQERLKTLRCR